jgi:hypothetical protein
MTERLATVIVESAAAVALAVLSMPQAQRDLLTAQTMQLTAKVSRRIAESCLRYAIRTENKAARLVSP